MRIVSALIAGVRGAENGTADVYKKGTRVRATIYSDIDGSTHPDNGSQLSLDSNGSIEAYVNEYVDIVVKGSDGTTVHEWTEGDTANNVEYRGKAFTGTDPDNGSTGTGSSYPISLQEILDLWYTNAGGDPNTAGTGIDWKVTAGGTTATLATWLGQLAGTIYFNVRDPTYGATGDGSTDDTTAIAAAITAANAAGGGTVFFPEGTYVITSQLTLTAGVNMLGVGGFESTITMNHASNSLLAVTPASYTKQRIEGLAFTAAQANTGTLLSVTNGNSELTVEDCYFGGTNCDATQLIDDGAAAQNVLVRNCRFDIGDNLQSAITCDNHTSGRWVIEGCRFETIATFNSTNGIIYGDYLDVLSCHFDTGTTTSGTYSCFAPSAAAAQVTLLGNYFETSGGATVTAYNFGDLNSGCHVYEDGTRCPGQDDANFTLYTLGSTGTADATDTVILKTRETRSYYISNDDASATVDYLNFGFFRWEKTGTTTITSFSSSGIATTPPNGGRVFGVIYSGSGTIASVTSGTYITGFTDANQIANDNYSSFVAVGSPSTGSGRVLLILSELIDR